MAYDESGRGTRIRRATGRFQRDTDRDGGRGASDRRPARAARTWRTSSTTRRTARSAATGSACTSPGRACCCSAVVASASCSIANHRTRSRGGQLRQLLVFGAALGLLDAGRRR